MANTLTRTIGDNKKKRMEYEVLTCRSDLLVPRCANCCTCIRIGSDNTGDLWKYGSTWAILEKQTEREGTGVNRDELRTSGKDQSRRKRTEKREERTTTLVPVVGGCCVVS